MIDLIFDLYQQRRINDAEQSAQTSNERATASQSGVRELEESVARLTLINAAMWSLLKDRTGVTDAALVARMKQLDLKDGVEDGRITGDVQSCTQCGRVMGPRHRRCLYCGGERLTTTPFQGI